MRKTKLLIFVGLVLATSLVLTACGGGQTTEASVLDQPVDTSAGSGGDASDPDEAGPSVPEDIPIMDGARDLQVTNEDANINYEVDGTVDDVVGFYQTELVDLGWEMTRSPDTVVGAMATMARENAAGDRLTFSLQYNPIGEFVVVQIVVLRAQ